MAKKKKEFKELSTGQEVVNTVFSRSRWKHFIRWIIFCFVLFLYISLLLLSYRSHFLLHKGFLLQEFVVYIMCSLMMLPILPSVVLEVDYVKLEEDGIIFQNLIFKKFVKWEDIRKFTNPLYLKFAIVRTARFVYLLNRRDIPNFDELAEKIREKAINLPK